MSDKDLTKKDLQEIKNAKPIFNEKAFPKVKKKIDIIIKELDKQLAENKKIIEEKDREILETMRYEQFLKLIRLV